MRKNYVRNRKQNRSFKISLIGITFCLMLITTSFTAVSTTMDKLKESNSGMKTDREYTDVSVTAINSPLDVTYPGNRTVSATIENFGDTYQDVLVNCSINHLFLYEDFSDDMFPPFGWVEQEPGEWRKINQSYAGGEPPEAQMAGFNADKSATLKSVSIDTTNASQLILEFKHYINDYYLYLAQFRVWTRMNDSDIWTDVTPWSNPIDGDIGPENVVIDISHDIGPETQVMWWYFTNMDWDRSWWCIDDVAIYDPTELVYTSSEIIPVNANSTDLVEFSPPWDVAVGFYNVIVEAFVADDENQSNDQLSKIVTVEVPQIDPDLSFLNLTGESALGLTTCPAGDGPTYEYVKVTTIDSLGIPITGILADDFSFFAMLGNNTANYSDLNDHLIWIPEDVQTDENGEIRFTVQADTSIGADIIAPTGEGGYITIEVTVDNVTINNTEDLLVNSCDINVDGWVNRGDFNTFQVDFGLNRQRSDYDWNGKVTLSDFNFFAVHYGHRYLV